MGRSERAAAHLALVVEDDIYVRELAGALLEESDLDVVEVEDADAALAFLQRRGGEVAMVLADVRLPGLMDGVDLARAVSKMWPHVNMVVTSGDPGDRLARLPEDATYMPKPWRALDILVQAERAVRAPAVPVA